MSIEDAFVDVIKSSSKTNVKSVYHKLFNKQSDVDNLKSYIKTINLETLKELQKYLLITNPEDRTIKKILIILKEIEDL